MNTCLFAALACLGLGGSPRTIDAFDYPTDAAARAVWVVNAPAPPVTMISEGGRRMLKLSAPFADNAKLDRVHVDRDVRLDLATTNALVLEVSCDRPEAFAHLTLYFRSGGGWYGAAGSLAKKGLQRIVFDKASFDPEGTPAGWDRIDGIRIAGWQGQPVNAALSLARLDRVWRDVAVVVPDGAEGEAAESRQYAERVVQMLAKIGLAADTVSESSLVRDGLADRRVVILPHNPSLPAAADEALARYCEAGGKALVCYQLPAKLGAALGFGSPKWLKQERPGQFAQIRFEAPDVAGLPEMVRQASWNVTTAEPVAHGARVIGRWLDDQGKPTGRAAMLLGDRGAHLGHVLLADDPEGKERLLAAVLGRLAPPLWEEMARSRLAEAGQVGHCDGAKAVLDYVRAQARPEAEALAAQAEATLAKAKTELAAGKPAEAVRLAGQAREELVGAYLRGQPSPPREGRGWWNHSGTGAYPGDWERTAKELAASGFNMVFPNMLWGGLAHYPSDVLPRSPTFEQYGDQIAQCVEAAHKHGIEVHVWKVNYNLGNAPKEFVEKLRREHRTQVSVEGRPIDWLCPSHPENFKLELDSLIEVAQKYDVDGLHFDYIRYPGNHCCYCDGCRGRFETDSGRKVEHWPADCHSGGRADEYHDWRCKQITQLVEAVHREAKRLKPGVRISAAVFGGYPACRQSIGQDWVHWAKAGYVDFLCPMDYTNSDQTFRSLVGRQLQLVEGKVPLYPGIGATSSASALPVDRVVGQIHAARELGAGGFTIFNLSQSTAETILPGVGLGAGAAKAVPPHVK